jgi:hypothetical protein
MKYYEQLKIVLDFCNKPVDEREDISSRWNKISGEIKIYLNKTFGSINIRFLEYDGNEIAKIRIYSDEIQLNSRSIFLRTDISTEEEYFQESTITNTMDLVFAEYLIIKEIIKVLGTFLNEMPH